MQRVIWMLLAILASLHLSLPVDAAFATNTKKLSLREEARQHHLLTRQLSPPVTIDGTPKPRSRPEASQSTVIGESGMESPVGGDDVVVAVTPDIGPAIPLEWTHIEIAADGRIFAIVTYDDQIDVYLSTDTGDFWTLWSSLVIPDPHPTSDITAVTMAEGNTSRLFVAYRGYAAGPTAETRVAYVEINAAFPIWVVSTVQSGPGGDVLLSWLDITTDVANYAGYYVYVAAEHTDSDGSDIWFNRSTTMGSSYDTAYRVADTSVETQSQFHVPWISYGANDWIHLSYVGRNGIFPAGETGAYYRRAANWGNGGIGAWEPQVTIIDSTGTADASNMALAASSANGVVCAAVADGSIWIPATIRYSTDHGATWPPGNAATPGFIGEYNLPLLILPSGEIAAFGNKGGPDPHELQISRSNTSAPGTWSTPESFCKYTPSFGSYTVGMASDPTHGDRMAMIWGVQNGTSTDVRFDAEWRRDPGYGNTDVGFPLAFGVGGYSPPAAVDLDGDSYQEIVFGTTGGDIYVVDHMGVVVQGWPVNIGGMPANAPVAIGDLAGNGSLSIVAGSSGGEVYAFNPDGTTQPGWPVQMNIQSDVYVSIGALGPPNPRYVVALCDKEMRAIRYDGADVSPGWGTFTDVLTWPAAIGDIDNDGTAEIVTLKGSYYHAHRLDQGTPSWFRNISPGGYSAAPTLADLDLDGDLEVAAPAYSGRMYVMHHDGSDLTGWPVTVSSGSSLTSAALANFLGTSEPDVAFGEHEWTGWMHLYFYDGVEQSAYPQYFFSMLEMAPIITPADPGRVANIVFSSFGGNVQNYRNTGGSAVGWPRNLDGVVSVTPASGDIDNDGRNEVVILGTDFLTVLDVGVPPATNPNQHWPMWGYDPQRTGCLNCEEIVTGVDIEEDTPALLDGLALDVRPNPFNPTAVISFAVPSAGLVTVSVFDIRGRLVDTIVDAEFYTAQRHTVYYHSDLPSGVYLLRVQTQEQSSSRKIVLLK